MLLTTKKTPSTPERRALKAALCLEPRLAHVSLSEEQEKRVGKLMLRIAEGVQAKGWTSYKPR